MVLRTENTPSICLHLTLSIYTPIPTSILEPVTVCQRAETLCLRRKKGNKRYLRVCTYTGNHYNKKPPATKSDGTHDSFDTTEPTLCYLY